MTQKVVVVTDTTNPEIDRLNRLLQDAREERGQLSGPELEVIDLTPTGSRTCARATG